MGEIFFFPLLDIVHSLDSVLIVVAVKAVPVRICKWTLLFEGKACLCLETKFN